MEDTLPDIGFMLAENKVRPGMQENRTCVRCRAEYVEAENIGSWKCQQHKTRGLHYDKYKELRWKCCGHADNVSGCQKSDHTNDQDYVYTEKDNVAINELAKSRYNPESLVFKDNTWFVSRARN